MACREESAVNGPSASLGTSGLRIHADMKLSIPGLHMGMLNAFMEGYKHRLSNSSPCREVLCKICRKSICVRLAYEEEVV
jgi:hypothetical protein